MLFTDFFLYPNLIDNYCLLVNFFQAKLVNFGVDSLCESML